MGNTKMYFYGCIDDAGHYLWDNENRRSSYETEKQWDATNPFPMAPPNSKLPREERIALSVDGGIQPHGRQMEHQAALHHRKGWSAIGFWDRSIDKRQGSCGAFIMEGEHDFSDIITIAKEQWPNVMKRIGVLYCIEVTLDN